MKAGGPLAPVYCFCRNKNSDMGISCVLFSYTTVTVATEYRCTYLFSIYRCGLFFHSRCGSFLFVMTVTFFLRFFLAIMGSCSCNFWCRCGSLFLHVNLCKFSTAVGFSLWPFYFWFDSGFPLHFLPPTATSFSHFYVFMASPFIFPHDWHLHITINFLGSDTGRRNKGNSKCGLNLKYKHCLATTAFASIHVQLYQDLFFFLCS